MLKSSLANLVVIVLLVGVAVAGPREDGMEAIEQGDFGTALRLLTPLANEGDAEAQHNLGVMYVTGSGVTQDLTIAKGWFERAAEQNHPLAQNSLGIMYANGEGVPEDHDVSYVWFSLSAASGEAEAIKNKSALAEAMTPEQIAAAEQMTARRRQGHGFSTVEGEVLLIRGLSVFRNCAIEEFNKQKVRPPIDAAVSQAISKCEYLMDALVGDLVRVDPRLDQQALQVEMQSASDKLRATLLP